HAGAIVALWLHLLVPLPNGGSNPKRPKCGDSNGRARERWGKLWRHGGQKALAMTAALSWLLLTPDISALPPLLPACSAVEYHTSTINPATSSVTRPTSTLLWAAAPRSWCQAPTQ